MRYIRMAGVVSAIVLLGAGCAKQQIQPSSVFEGEDFGPLNLVFTLSEQNNSGERGTAYITPMSETTAKVIVEATGVPTGVDQPMHIHTGSCPTPGAVKYPLNSLVNGKSETVLQVSVEQLVAELPLALNLHKSSGEASVYVACGNLPSGKN